MNLCSYKEEALKTNTSAWDLQDHMVSGVITEIGEIVDAHKKHLAYGKTFDSVNEQEELGDTWWYLAGLMEDCSFPCDGENLFSLESVTSQDIGFLDLFFLVSQGLIEYCEADRNTTKTVALACIMDFLHAYATQRGYSTEKIWEANINKLRKRYGDKFSSKRAIDRNIAVEREGLEMDFESDS